MKNNVKNALNALVLLGFMVLSWATSRELNLEPVRMEVKINADSTAFLLKNLENIDFSNGNAQITSFSDSTRALSAFFFFADSVSVKANAEVAIPFSKFKTSNRAGGITIFSKDIKFNRFVFNGFLRKGVSGFFELNF